MDKVAKRPIPQSIIDGRLLTAEEAMVYLNVSKRMLNDMTVKWTADHRVPSYKFGKPRRYKLDELNWWLEKHRAPL